MGWRVLTLFHMASEIVTRTWGGAFLAPPSKSCSSYTSRINISIYDHHNISTKKIIFFFFWVGVTPEGRGVSPHPKKKKKKKILGGPQKKVFLGKKKGKKKKKKKK